MKTKHGSIGFIFVLALALAATAGAYVLKNYQWVIPHATYNGSALSSSWRNALSYGADRWENTGDFDWTASSTSFNKMYLQSIDGRGSVYATTFNDYYNGWLYHTDICFDSDESWHTSSTTPSSLKLDARSVATHEFGHALGLGHTQSSRCSVSVSESSRPTMCPTYGYGKTWSRSLESDDRNGVEAQYSTNVASGTVASSITNTASLVSSRGFYTCADVDFTALSEEDRSREASIILHGTVTSVGPTLWNSDDGLRWNDPASKVAPMPYHLIEVALIDVVYDQTKSVTGSSSVTIMIPVMSSLDRDVCGDSVGPFEVGSEAVLFLQYGSQPWKTGEKHRFLRTVTEPAASAVTLGSDGLFYELGAENTPEGRTLDELRISVSEQKNTSD